MLQSYDILTNGTRGGERILRKDGNTLRMGGVGLLANLHLAVVGLDVGEGRMLFQGFVQDVKGFARHADFCGRVLFIAEDNDLLGVADLQQETGVYDEAAVGAEETVGLIVGKELLDILHRHKEHGSATG